MKVFNIFATVVFTVLGMLVFMGMFFNFTHIITTIICFLLALLAFFDDSHGESLYDKMQELIKEGKK